jgi:hypothetical protein
VSLYGVKKTLKSLWDIWIFCGKRHTFCKPHNRYFVSFCKFVFGF